MSAIKFRDNITKTGKDAYIDLKEACTRESYGYDLIRKDVVESLCDRQDERLKIGRNEYRNQYYTFDFHDCTLLSLGEEKKDGEVYLKTVLVDPDMVEVLKEYNWFLHRTGKEDKVCRFITRCSRKDKKTNKNKVYEIGCIVKEEINRRNGGEDIGKIAIHHDKMTQDNRERYLMAFKPEDHRQYHKENGHKSHKTFVFIDTEEKLKAYLVYLNSMDYEVTDFNSKS